MARPNSPNYFAPRRCWRFVYDGKTHYFGKDIAPTERPMVGDKPKRAWDTMNAIIRGLQGQATAATDPTVRWLAELYLEWCDHEREAGRLSAGQYAGHRTHLARFAAHVLGDGRTIGDIRALALGADAAGEFFDTARAEGYSDHYVANLGKSVRAMLNWAARPVKGRVPSRLLPENPLRGYGFPRAPGAVRGYVEGAIVRRFLRWAWARSRRQPGLMKRFDRLYVLMLWFQRLTGCRPGEACRLEWSEIDWAAELVTIDPGKHKTGRKTGKARKIHLTPPVVRLLRAIERLPDRHTQFVFTHRRVNGAIDRGQESATAGEPWQDGSSASQKVTDWRREAIAEGLPLADVGPLKLVAYANRHAYASEAVSRYGMTSEHAAELLGNTRAVVEQVYAHSIDDAAAQRAREFAAKRRSGSRGEKG